MATGCCSTRRRMRSATVTAERRRAIGQDDRELLAAVARHGVHRAHALQQALAPPPAARGRRPAWPRVSLTCLKWSMSTISTNAGSPARATRSISRASATRKLAPVGEARQRRRGSRGRTMHRAPPAARPDRRAPATRNRTAASNCSAAVHPAAAARPGVAVWNRWARCGRGWGAASHAGQRCGPGSLAARPLCGPREQGCGFGLHRPQSPRAPQVVLACGR